MHALRHPDPAPRFSAFFRALILRSYPTIKPPTHCTCSTAASVIISEGFRGDPYSAFHGRTPQLSTYSASHSRPSVFSNPPHYKDPRHRHRQRHHCVLNLTMPSTPPSFLCTVRPAGSSGLKKGIHGCPNDKGVERQSKVRTPARRSMASEENGLFNQVLLSTECYPNARIPLEGADIQDLATSTRFPLPSP